MRFYPLVVVLCLAGLGPTASAQVALHPAPPTASLRPSADSGFYLEPVTPEGLGVVVDVEVAPDGRVFVLEKNTGALRVFSPTGELLAWEWVVLWPEVFADGDRGALGFTFHPDFPEVPHVYILYTLDDSPDPRPESRFRAYGRVVRYSADPEDPNRADPESRTVILGETYHDGIPACFNSHSVGTLAFGHDGTLFVGSGDAATWAVELDTGGEYPECFSADPEAGVHPSEDVGAFRSQRLESLAGKVLRIDPETGLGLPSNPFYTGDPADAASKVWALGLRNPFRFSVAPPEAGGEGPGTLLIGDVGDRAWEELNVAEGGENFGWPCREGPEAFGPADGVTEPFDCAGPWAGAPTEPVAYWHHRDPDRSSPAGDIGRSATGGVVYTGEAYPEAFRGAYFFADYTAGWVRAARLGADGLEGVVAVADEAGPLVDLANEPGSGALLAVDVGAEYGNGSVVRIRYGGAGGSPPIARIEASDRTGEAPATLAFRGGRSADPDGGELTYAWAFGDGATAQGAAVEHTFDRVGTYPVTLVVRDTDGQESRAAVTVRVGETMPDVEIVSPQTYTIPPDYRLTLRATADDPLEGPGGLRAEWTVDLVHNDHVHPRFFAADGLDADVYLLPHAGDGETAHYRATVTVTDSEGLVRRLSRTFREDPPSEIDVAPAGTMARAGGGVDVVFPEAVRVGRVGLPGHTAVPEGLRVEARLGGAWGEVPFPSALVEGDAVQVIFGTVDADAIRVTGADSVAVYARVEAEGALPGGGEGVDMGAPEVPGRAGVDDGHLVVVGGGTGSEGSGHAVQTEVYGDGGVVVRLDALAARPGGGAGATLRAGVEAEAPGATALATPGGDVVLWTYGAGAEVRRDVVGTWEGQGWLRLARTGARLDLATSSDGEDWRSLATRVLALPETVLAGPAVVGGDPEGAGRVAVGWFGAVEYLRWGEGPGVPEEGAFAIEGVYPNPATHSARLVVEAGRRGTYRLSVVDLLGRVVARGATVTVGAPRQMAFEVDLRGVGAGTYLAQVTHTESGEAVARPVVVVP